MNPDLFEQHARLKSQYPGVILLLRVGDFYEAFGDDADTLARVCNLAKTTRAGHRMAGFPDMHLNRFLTVLVKAGFRVATCDPVLDKPSGKAEVVRWPCADEGG